MRRLISLVTATIVVATLLACSARAQHLEQVAAGFNSPVVITNAGDERVFVVEQRGTIRVIDDGAVSDTPFLDIRDRVQAGGERGLLGLAFPADHAQSGRFYVYYTDKQGDTVVSRFVVAGDSGDQASEQILVTQDQPFGNHNGGQIAFGPDG